MDSLNLTYNSLDTHIGIAFLYDNIIDTIDFDNLKAVIYYFIENNENKVKVWKDINGNLQLEQKYSKISHFIAKEDIYRLDIAENLGTNQVLLMIDQTVIPTTQYYSEFQTAIDKNYLLMYPSDPDFNNRRRWCSRDIANCPDDDYERTCAFRESPFSGSRSYCGATFCASSSASSLLIDNNTPLDSIVLHDMYDIKDHVLLNDNTNEYLIDDYYYLSSIIAENITLSIALDIKDLSNTNFLRVFKNYNNSIYADSVLITSISKPIIIDICNKSKIITTDTRAISIINNTINLANNYDNKTITYIKND